MCVSLLCCGRPWSLGLFDPPPHTHAHTLGLILPGHCTSSIGCLIDVSKQGCAQATIQGCAQAARLSCIPCQSVINMQMHALPRDDRPALNGRPWVLCDPQLDMAVLLFLPVWLLGSLTPLTHTQACSCAHACVCMPVCAPRQAHDPQLPGACCRDWWLQQLCACLLQLCVIARCWRQRLPATSTRAWMDGPRPAGTALARFNALYHCL